MFSCNYKISKERMIIMSNESIGIYSVIRRPTKNENKPLSKDQHAAYQQMSQDLKCDINAIMKHRQLLQEILNPLEKEKGSLVFLNDGKSVYFALNGIPFTNFGVILMEVINAHSLDQTQFYVVLLILSQHEEPKIIKIKVGDLDSIRWVEKLGVSFICEKHGVERIKFFVQTMAKFAPTKNVYLYSGWIPGENAYALNSALLVSNDFDLCSAKSRCEHALEMLNVASHSLTIPLLAIELLSLVHSKMTDAGTYFKGVCCIVAPTQSFKTTIAALFFDHNSGREADINFEATTAAIVRTIGNARDTTVVLDDFKPGATKAERNDMLLKLSKVIRMCSDDSGGIKKAGIDNSTISNTASCLVVVTAEEIQLNVQSTLARLLVLEMNRKTVNNDKLTYFQNNHSMYQEFIRDFIKYICSQGVNSYCEKLAQQFLTERNSLKNKILDSSLPIDNRTSDMSTWLYISFMQFLKYAAFVNAITEEKIKCLSEEAESIFISIIKQQAERVADLDDTKRFFTGLQILLGTQEAQIATLQARNTSFSAPNSKTAIGFSKKDFVYLKNGIALQAVIAYYQHLGKEFFPNETTLRKALGNSGYIIPKSKSSYIHRLHVNNEDYQCIKFQKAQFEKLINGGAENGTEDNREIPDNWSQHKNSVNYLGR